MIQPNEEMVTLTIDEQSISVPKGTTIIEAARSLGIAIPHYCYDRDLSIVASCRLCLVEIEKVPKLQPSCSTPVAEGQIVYTCSEKVLDARRMQMEFLLVQHPLDCPVCDQGGECKLQEYSMQHGYEDTRFAYQRRTHPKPDIGPLIDLERNRCILCSRCVRFMDEIAGDAELAIVSRGWKSHISTFQEQPLKNEFAGNTIDLCPVGALTSKVTRFRTRVWELKSKTSICSLCSVGCNIYLQHRNRTREILRVVPRINDQVNSRWICDVGRFGFDQFNHHARLTKPLVKIPGENQVETRWAVALDTTVKQLQETIAAKGHSALAGIISPRMSNETLFLFQQFFRDILQSNNIDHRTEHSLNKNEDGYITSLALRATNQPFQEIRKASTIVLLGSDLPNELPILHLQIRKRVTEGARLLTAYPWPTRLCPDGEDQWNYKPGSESIFLAKLLRVTAREKGVTLSHEIAELLKVIETKPFEETTGISEQRVVDFAKSLCSGTKTTLLVGESVFACQAGSIHTRLCAEIAHLISTHPSDPLPLSLILPHMNSRGAADMGCYPHMGAGFEPIDSPGRNTTQILEGCIDGSIQALILFQSNVLEEYPNRNIVQEALEKVPFLVVAHSQPIPSLHFADVVLPLSTYTEEDGTYTNVEGRVQRAEKAMDQLEGTLTGYQVLLALGERWGAGWRQVRPMQVLDMISKAVSHYEDITWETIGSEGQNVKPVDISLFQKTLSLTALSVPEMKNPAPDRFLFRLVRGRFLFDTSGDKCFAPPLVKRSEECKVEIHPKDAERLQLQNGQLVLIQGPLGQLNLPVFISNHSYPGCITVLGSFDGIALNGLASDDHPWVTLQV